MSSAREILGGIPKQWRNSVVSDIHLAQIATELKSWEEIAPWLKLSEAQEEEIRHDFKDRYGLQKREALRKWRQMKGSEATYERLIVALCCAKNVDLATKVRASLEDEDAEENPVMKKFRLYLIDCCKQAQHPSYEQRPTLEMSIYVSLSLVALDGSDVRLSSVLQGEGRQVILIEGPPGSGKTTLTWHISQQWAEGKLFHQFYLLIPITLANAGVKTKYLADIIPHPSKKVKKKVADTIAEKEGKGVCFLIDSWDEVPHSAEWQRSYLYNFLKGRVGYSLPHCSIVVTCRPAASSMLRTCATSILQIAEFDALKIEEFVDKSMDADNASRFLKILEEKPELFALCHLPLNITIAVYLYKTSNQELPSTHTKLYKAFIQTQLARHWQHRTPDGDVAMGIDVSNVIEMLPQEMLTIFQAICKLAYTGIRLGCSSFDQTAIKKAGLDPIAQNTLSLMQKVKDASTTTQRSFFHYTIQEYLAAYHITQLGPEQQSEAVKELLQIAPLTMTLPYYAGLTKLQNIKVFNLLLKVIKKPLDTVQVAKDLKQHVNEPGSDPRRLLLALMNSVYESEDVNFYNHIHPQALCDNGPVHLPFDGLNLLPTDCLSIGYFLRHTAIRTTELTPVLTVCNISDVGFKMLMRHIVVKEKPQNDILLNLTLNSNPLSHRALECIADGLGNRTLRIHLSGCFNTPVTEHLNLFTALKYLVKGVSQSSACIGISLGNNYITAVHKYYLALLMVCNKCLKGLILNYNDLRGAMPLLCAALNHSSLDWLDISDCCLGNEDLKYLANALRDNKKMRYLFLRGNDFSSGMFTKFLTVLLNSNSRICYLEYHKQLNETQRRILDDINCKRKKYDQLVVKRKNPIEESSKEWRRNVMLLPHEFLTGRKDRSFAKQ